MIPQQVNQLIDESFNPLRVFASPNKIPSENDISNDQGMEQTKPMNADTASAQPATVHLIPFNPEQLIQDCDDFSISSCETQSFLHDDFHFVSSNSDAFWEQGVVTAPPTFGRQDSVSNVSLTSVDESMQSSTSQDDMQLS
ncbi:MAG: hypothetical protein SGBAC_000045 [Bacillariaceae sp.]